jgi:hypothetical protein
MIDRAGTKFAKKFLCPQRLQVVNEMRPQMQNIVAREAVALLDNNGPPAEEGYLDRYA